MLARRIKLKTKTDVLNGSRMSVRRRRRGAGPAAFGEWYRMLVSEMEAREGVAGA